MLVYMKKVVLTGSELNIEERNLLSVAYKNSVGSRRYFKDLIINHFKKDPPHLKILIGIL